MSCVAVTATNAMLSLIGMGRRPTVLTSTSNELKDTNSTTLLPPLGTQPRLVQKEGFILKEGESWKTWHKRFFKLNGLTLAYYDKEVLKGMISLNNAIVRESHRKGLEYGFEVIVNPTQATRDAVLALATNGEKDYTSTNGETSASSSNHHRTTSSSVSAPGGPSTTATTGRTSISHEPERIYVLCIEDTNAGALRREWISAITNNIEYDQKIRTFLLEREEKYDSALNQLRQEVESVRAEREMELLEKESQKHEIESKKKADALLDEEHAAQVELYLQRAASSENMNAMSPVTPSSANSNGGIISTLPPSELIIALKRKNTALETESRMFLTENESLKAVLQKTQEQAQQAELRCLQQLQQLNQLQAQVRELTAQQQQLNVTTLMRNTSVENMNELPSSSSMSSTTGSSAADDIISQQTTPLHAAGGLMPRSPTIITNVNGTATPVPGSASITPSTSFSTGNINAPSGIPTPSLERGTSQQSSSSDLLLQQQLTLLQSTVSQLTQDKQVLETTCQRYKQEKKVLKSEVIRLRGIGGGGAQ